MRSFFRFCIGISALFLFQAATPPSPPDAKSERYRNLELFQKVLHFVENNYVEETKNQELIYGAIKGMLETLDPHSNFLPPEIYKDMKIDTAGEFGGLGLEIGIRDGVLTVIAPIEDTPAWKAGVKPGDRIVKINGESTKGMTLSQAVAKMRGLKGNPAIITLFRKGSTGFKVVTLKRATVRLQSVKSESLDPGYGYLRLTSFNENAAKDMEAAIQKLMQEQGKGSKQPLKGLVLDLRGNPGGLLEQAVEVSSLFVDDGVIVSTAGRSNDQKDVRYAKRGKAHKEFPLAILVNSSTASAAEIVAGSLQDLKRAVILGQRTFGKGSVQTVIELGEDMGLKLTIARYYTASGRSIQEQGVIPDIALDEYDLALLKKAKLKKDTVREKDLPGHIGGKKITAEPFTVQELESLAEKKKTLKEKLDQLNEAESDSEEDIAGLPVLPKKDFEVQQALNYLKSYEVLKDKFQLAAPPIKETNGKKADNSGSKE